MKLRGITCLGIIVLAGAVVSCGELPGKPKRGSKVERLPRVEVVQPIRKRLVRRLDVAATVEALQKGDLNARVPGVVYDLDDKIDIGLEVAKDQELLRLSVPDLDAEKAQKTALLSLARQ